MSFSHMNLSERHVEAPLSGPAFSTGLARADGRTAFRCDRHRGLAKAAINRGLRPETVAHPETWRLGPFAVTQATTAGMRLERWAGDRAADEGDLWVFRLSRSSAANGPDADRADRIAPGQLWLKRAKRPALTLLPAGEHTLLTLPVEAFPDLTAGLSRLPAGRIEGAGAGLLAEILAVLPLRLRAASAGDLAPLAEVMRGMIACALLVDQGRADDPAACGAAVSRDRVIRVMLDNIGSARLDVERICRLTGVSRSALYRMFERDGGVASFIRDARLRLVLADLQDPALAHLQIARIAERRGLHNAPSFSRAFRRAFGCSPSQARAAARRGAAPTPASPPPEAAPAQA